MEFMDSWLLLHENAHHLKTIYNYPHETTVDSSSSHAASTFPALENTFMEENTDLESLVATTTSDDRSLVYRQPPWVIFVLIIGYLFVLVLGLIGNFSVLIVVAKNPRLSTVTNLFICNLALADLCALIFCILPNLVSNIFVPWVLGWFLCKTVPYIQGVSVCASIYSLVAISAERCHAIQWPLHAQLTKSTARSWIVAIWAWSSLVAAPWAIFFDIAHADEAHPELEFCVEVWPAGPGPGSFKWEGYYFLFGNLILCYLFPLGVISLCYFVIWLRVWRRPLLCDAQSRNSSVELIHQQAKAGVLKMLLAVILSFALSWLPLYLIFSRIKFGGTLSDLEIEIIDIGAPLSQWLSASNSMWNPWIYAFLNVKFRRAFNSLFCGKMLRRDPTPHYQKPNVNIMLKRLNMYKAGHMNTSSMFNVTDV